MRGVALPLQEAMNEPHNHYAPPGARVADPSPGSGPGGPMIPNRRRVPLLRGVHWIAQSSRIYFVRPGKWIGVMVLMFIAIMIPAFVSFVNVLSAVVTAFLFAGITLLADSQRRTGDFAIGDLFKGFSIAPQPLLSIGLVMLINTAVMFAVYSFYLGKDVALALTFAYGEISPDTYQMSDLWKAMAMNMVLAIPLYCVTYAAPQLVVMHGLSAGEAMRHSFAGLMRNLPTGILYAVMMSALAMLSALPLFLGLFITIPMYFIGTYVAYRDIFVGDDTF